MDKQLHTESIPKEERETIAVYSELTDTWSIHTSVRRHITKLTKIFDEEDISKALVDEDDRFVEINIENADASQVSFRNKSKPREMTEEQRQAAAERLRLARAKK